MWEGKFVFIFFFLPVLNPDLLEINIVQCHLHVIFVILQLKMLNSFFIICPSFGAQLEMWFAPIAHLLGDSWVLASDKRKTDWLFNGGTIIDFELTSILLFFCPLSSQSSPNQTALLDYILLPFPSFFYVIYIFFLFLFFLFYYFFSFFKVCMSAVIEFCDST